MFGKLNVSNDNLFVERVDFQIQNDSFYRTADGNGVIVINTPLARVYVNDSTFFAVVPESAWNASFQNEPSPREFLEAKIGKTLNYRDIADYQALLSDLIDAEFRNKSNE